ncbi:MAG: isochorismate synthase [Balneolaceae bacterium]
MMNLKHSGDIVPTEYIEALETKSFTGFLHSANRSASPLLSVTLPVAGIDPLAALELDTNHQEKFYWDHPENSITIAAAGMIREFKATGSNRFKNIADDISRIKKDIAAYTAIKHSMAGPLFLGGYSFEDHNVGKIWKKFGGARFVLPEWTLVKNGSLHLLTLTIEKNNRSADEIYQEIIEQITDFINLAGKLLQKKQPSVNGKTSILCTLQSPEDHTEWISKVKKARSLIRQKKFDKIVLARSVSVESKFDLQPTVLAHGLRQKFPECYNFMIQRDPDTAFIGAAPERLVSLRKEVVLTEGLAGSISRGHSASEDAALAHTLMKSRKDRSEHQFVVQAISESLKLFSDSIEHPDQPSVKKLQNVQHLFTPISASPKDGVQIHELIQELHPTPAVGGFPKQKAVPYIQELEQIERGWYSAPVGWFNLSGCGEFAVAIRSALLHKNRAELYAGCGIVSDSDPENEWKETLLKFRPIMEALIQPEENYE